jgi:Fe2+ or Zn2+ uptake regulation protein
MRITPQRARIWEALVKSSGHLSAEEVWEEVRETLPGLELSTVYRALEALEEAGLVVESRFSEGPRIFEAQPSVHPHLVCEGCGEIFHPRAEVGNRLLEVLWAGAEGFEVRELHAMAKGLCAACAVGEGRGD